MRRLVIFLTVMSLILVLAGCSNRDDGPVWPGNNQNPTVPPPGNNPGSSTYQLMCTIDLSRTTGDAPMAVNMSANVVGGLAPFYYRWDVQNDGWWDYGGAGANEIGINYASAGTYTILLEVEDSSGQSFRATAIVQVRPSGPAAYPVAIPSVGSAPLQVTLDGSTSYDADGFIVLYEWDFESDGVFDYESETNPNAVTTYPNQGTYNATLRVTDDDGLMDEASVQIVAL